MSRVKVLLIVLLSVCVFAACAHELRGRIEPWLASPISLGTAMACFMITASIMNARERKRIAKPTE